MDPEGAQIFVNVTQQQGFLKKLFKMLKFMTFKIIPYSYHSFGKRLLSNV